MQKSYMTSVRCFYLNEFGKSLVSLSNSPINYQDEIFSINESIQPARIQRVAKENLSDSDYTSEQVHSYYRIYIISSISNSFSFYGIGSIIKFKF